MVKDIVSAAFTFFRSIELSPVDIQQVNDRSLIGMDGLLKFKLTFSDDFSIACFMTYINDWVDVKVYLLEFGCQYKYFVQAQA